MENDLYIHAEHDLSFSLTTTDSTGFQCIFSGLTSPQTTNHLSLQKHTGEGLLHDYPIFSILHHIFTFHYCLKQNTGLGRLLILPRKAIYGKSKDYLISLKWNSFSNYFKYIINREHWGTICPQISLHLTLTKYDLFWQHCQVFIYSLLEKNIATWSYILNLCKLSWLMKLVQL